jgi:transcriptional regulator with XRE-family HTH domain
MRYAQVDVGEPGMTNFDRWLGYDASIGHDLVAQISAALRQFREEAGLSQTQLAAILDMTQPNVARIEGGKIAPTFQVLQRLAHVLNVCVSVNIGPDRAEISFSPLVAAKPEKATRRRAG